MKNDLKTTAYEKTSFLYFLHPPCAQRYATLPESLASIAQSAGNTNANTDVPEYLYNGKEKQAFEAAATNYLDYGARFYNPVIIRWNTQDPMAEKYQRYSPYSYCVNDPINLVDPNGMDGMVTGSGTEDDPYVITAKYFYNKKDFENKKASGAIKAFIKAINNYNETGVVKTEDATGKTIYGKYNLSIEEVDDTQESYNNTAFTTEDGQTKYYGNIVNSGIINQQEDNKNDYFAITKEGVCTITFDNNVVENYHLLHTASTFAIYLGIMIHEIGHTLGGEHNEPGDNMIDPIVKSNDNMISNTPESIVYPSNSKEFLKHLLVNINIPSPSISTGIWKRK